MGDNCIKNSRIKILKSHTHLLIIGRQFTKFQVNPMKDVRGVAETRSHGRTAGRTVGRTDGITHTWTDEGHFYSPLRLRRTQFQMNPMEDVERVVETRSWLAKFKSAWAITPSKIVELKF